MADDFLGKLNEAVKTVQTGAKSFTNFIDNGLKFQPRLGRYKPGAEPNTAIPATPTFNGKPDLRVKLLVPLNYLNKLTRTVEVSYVDEESSGSVFYPVNVLRDAGGIIFPYTPNISYETSAEYTPLTPLHSNYPFYFYKNSKIGQIQLNGRFTVQNDKDARMWLEILHLMRGLTKMKFGADPDAGAPPPICKLQAYGDGMINNVPVVVQSFRQELNYETDYYQYEDKDFGPSMIPVTQTLTTVLLPMYSRAEMSTFSVDKFLSGEFRGKGFL